MKTDRLAVLALALLAAGCGGSTEPPSETSSAALPACDPDNGGLTLPAGFCGLIVADNLGPARHLAVTPSGDVYVRLRRVGDQPIGVVALRDADGDGRAETVQRFGEDHAGTGLGLWGDYLYVSTDVSVLRYRLTAGELVPGTPPEVVVEGFVEQQADAAKPFAFDDQNNLYVNVGSPANSCQEKNNEPGSPGLMPCKYLDRHAGIWRFPADRVGQNFERDGYRFATGIRNSNALDWHPDTRALFVVVHGRGRLNDMWPKLFTAEQNADLPSEEFLRLSDGIDHGYPYCYHDPAQNKRVLSPEYGGDGKQEGDCAKYPAPLYFFPAHLAPNDLLFYSGTQFPDSYRGGALIAFHGSNNRTPLEQKGYQIGFLPMRDGKPSGEWTVFADGFAGATPIMNVSEAQHRPMGLAQGPDGSLYVADSVRGRIWRIVFRGESAGAEPR
jgi:glucose/arabinose dehydrogenase